MSCLSFTDLCAANAAAEFGEHIDVCPRCRAIIARIDHDEPVLGSAPQPSSPPLGAAPRPGGVWAFSAPGVDEYVVGAVLAAEPTELLVVPLLAEADWATADDVVFPAEVLGYASLAPVWAGDHLLVEQAVEAVDVLSETDLETLAAGYEAFFTGEPLDEPGGAPVLGDEDPRIDAHAAIADRLRALYAPWGMMHVADELGPVLAQRREELGLQVAELAVKSDVGSRTWASFEAGEADPYELIPVPALGRAVRALGLLASRRLIHLAEASVLSHHQGEAVARPRALARRRRGVIPRSGRDPEAAQAAADQYASALAKELGL